MPLRLPREFGAGVRLLHVVEPDAYYDSDGHPIRVVVMQAYLEKSDGREVGPSTAVLCF